MPRQGLQINDITAGIGWSDAANLLRGTINPQGVLTAARGSIYILDDPAAPAQVWVNEIGANSWVRVNTGGTNLPANFIFVTALSDLPTAVGGVITLAADTTYYFLDIVDLLGARLVGGENTTLLGSSPQSSGVRSTGLGAGVALLTTQWTTPIRFFSFRDVDTAVEIDDNGGAGAPLVLDWMGVHFVNIAHVGRVGDAYSLVGDNCAFVNSQDLTFDGAIGIVCFFKSQLMGATADPILSVTATASVAECFRIIQSMVATPAGGVGISFDPAASIPAEAYILDTVKFTGAGTYLAGVLSGTKTMFTDSPGIDNTSVNGLMYAQGNVLPTPIGNTTDFYKVVIVTTPGTTNEKYLHSNNRLTNDSVTQRKYLVTGRVDFTTSSNNIVVFGVFDSTIGALRVDSEALGTANAGGRAEGVNFQTVVQQVAGDYVEVWVRNTSSTTAVVVSDLTLIVTEIG
jgi:hypothetical protein